jgi:hypothetical protein
MSGTEAQMRSLAAFLHAMSQTESCLYLPVATISEAHCAKEESGKGIAVE